jgi:hypothetical protein
MVTLDQIQARLSAEIPRLIEARMNGNSTAILADEIEARLMQAASPGKARETPPTPTQPRQDEEAMPVLTDEIKTFIVKGLACYDTPSQVAEDVRVNFDIVVSRQQVHEYDPACARPPAQRWRDLHAATRQALLREQAEIGIAHRAVRLRRLDRLASRCERNGVTTALKCIEMAAKECGGMYERRQGTKSQPAAPELSAPLPAVAPPSVPERPRSEPATAAPAAPRSLTSPADTPQPVAPEPAAAQPQMSQPAMAQLSATPPAVRLLSAPLPVTPQPSTPKAPPARLSPERCREILQRWEASQNPAGSAAPAQPVLGNSRISTVPPAS